MKAEPKCIIAVRMNFKDDPKKLAGAKPVTEINLEDITTNIAQGLTSSLPIKAYPSAV